MKPEFNKNYRGMRCRVCLVREDTKGDRIPILQQTDVYELVKDELINSDRELFLSVMLTARNHLIGVETVSIGSVNAAMLSPREVFNIGDVILDPACGSGGFLIQAFKHVNHKIVESPLLEAERRKKLRELTDKCLWGNDADYDLHVLAKINLIMHGDGYNHITTSDTLQKNDWPTNCFDYILTNPPFTIKYEFPETLSQYEMGLGKNSEELDILFVEKCLEVLGEGGNLFIVLPEGLLNNRKFLYFREWLLQKADLLCSVSLPEGAFIPFGQSVSKTCIMGVRKKSKNNIGLSRPPVVFLGTPKEIGYETGKKSYKPKPENDLAEFLTMSASVFDGVALTACRGECGWISSDLVTSARLDSSFLLNVVDRKELLKCFQRLEILEKVCWINNRSVKPKPDQEYFYLEVPDISPTTGMLTNVRKVLGVSIKSDMHEFKGGELLFTRINPRISRVVIVPEEIESGLVSKEVYVLEVKRDSPILDKYVLCAVLQSDHVRNQIVRLATGSSSSRARVHPHDLLKDVYIPIPKHDDQVRISQQVQIVMRDLWKASQGFLQTFTELQNLLGSEISKHHLRSV